MIAHSAHYTSQQRIIAFTDLCSVAEGSISKLLSSFIS
jgi:hypothetical protein